jgi:hypothetical protein
MAMKETVGSLRAYFIVAGIISAIINALVVVHSLEKGIMLTVAYAGLGIALALAFLYVGVCLPTLLVESPGVINSVIFANMGFVVLNYVIICMFSDPQTVGSELVKHGIYFAICYYLLSNAKRLSKEEIEKTKPQEPAPTVGAPHA